MKTRPSQGRISGDGVVQPQFVYLHNLSKIHDSSILVELCRNHFDLTNTMESWSKSQIKMKMDEACFHVAF